MQLAVQPLRLRDRVTSRRGQELERRLADLALPAQARLRPRLLAEARAAQREMAAAILQVADEILPEHAVCARIGVQGALYAAARASAWQAFEALLTWPHLPRAYRDRVSRFRAECEQAAPALKQRPRINAVEGADYAFFMRYHSQFLKELERRAAHPGLRDLDRRKKRMLILIVVALALALLGLLFGTFLHQRRARPPLVASPAGRVIPLQTSAGRLLIHGDAQGRYFLTDARLRPLPVRGSVGREIYLGATGDLTGDGIPEIVLSHPGRFHPPLSPFLVHVLTPDATGYRPLAEFPASAGPYDEAFCQRTLAAFMDVLTSNLDLLSDEMRRARQRCTQIISQVLIEDGKLYLTRDFYGRDLLEVRCGAAGCGPPEQIFSVMSDVIGMARIGPPGRRRVALGTGCWDQDGLSSNPFSYGMLLLSGLDQPRALGFFRQGGRTMVQALDEAHVVSLAGSRCPGEEEGRRVASLGGGLAETRFPLRISELGMDDRLRVVDETSLDWLCPSGQRCDAVYHDDIAVLHDRAGKPALLALVFTIGVDACPAQRHLLIYDLRAPLSQGRPQMMPLTLVPCGEKMQVPDLRGGMRPGKVRPGDWPSFRLLAHDADGDGNEDLLVPEHTWEHGTLVLFTREIEGGLRIELGPG